MIKLGVIIPDRGDRPEFMENWHRQIDVQTFQPQEFCIVNYPAENDQVDITQRYRTGYEALRNKGLDLIAFMENDDAYSPNYLEFMVKAWIENKKPDLFGTTYTHYYHLKLQRYFTMTHYQRSSMMNTFLKPDLHFTWCADNIAYTDMHLWDNCKQLTRELITPLPVISLGIKHGFGLCGGEAHNNSYELYFGARGVNDPGGQLLKIVCPDSFDFYNKYYDPTFEKRIR